MSNIVDEFNPYKEFVTLKKECEVQLAEILSKAPGFLKVNVVSISRETQPMALTELIFDKSDMEEKEQESSLTLEKALVRWFALPEVKELYNAVTDFGIPIIITGTIIYLGEKTSESL